METTEKKTTDTAPPLDDGLIRMTLIFNPSTEKVLVHGPLARKGLCYMILEQAKDVVRKFEEQEQNRKALLRPPAGFTGKDGAHA